MRPSTCETCGGSGHDPVTSRRLPCVHCKGYGFNLASLPPRLKECLPAYILETLTEAGLD